MTNHSDRCTLRRLNLDNREPAAPAGSASWTAETRPRQAARETNMTTPELREEPSPAEDRPVTAIDVERYLSGRLEEQIDFYEKAAARAKLMHVRLQGGIIVLSVMVPVAVSHPQDWSGWPRFLVVAASLLLPAMTGLTSFRKYGETWISYRTTAELLKTEKYLFLTGSGRYRDNPNAFHDLVEAVEAQLIAEHTKFRASFTEVRQAAGGREETPRHATGNAA
jgi:Protein of unknown function (DUF4231)